MNGGGGMPGGGMPLPLPTPIGSPGIIMPGIMPGLMGISCGNPGMPIPGIMGCMLGGIPGIMPGIMPSPHRPWTILNRYPSFALKNSKTSGASSCPSSFFLVAPLVLALPVQTSGNRAADAPSSGILELREFLADVLVRFPRSLAVAFPLDKVIILATDEFVLDQILDLKDALVLEVILHCLADVVAAHL
eukprot:CAMPEP_0117602198 /NCGR_PEP_ID=MMETSP0784-20121206/77444_1 /TAXON_ID=39447 /ORGANISM="" /LENGTH=189 /DNA_ID=CAMNT_0005404983 /DNA_START=20 /DNA_END=590 /DNA_ORIENTATION=-